MHLAATGLNSSGCHYVCGQHVWRVYWCWMHFEVGCV